MFSFIKRNKETNNKQNSSADLPESSDETPSASESSLETPSPEADKKKGLFGRII